MSPAGAWVLLLPFLHAAGSRLSAGCSTPAGAAAAPGTGGRPVSPMPGDAQPKAQTAKIVVTEQGFEPAKISLRAGSLARLTFLRTTDKTCATEVIFPSLKIKRALPLNEPVAIEFTPGKSGDVAFACGMDMLKGVIVVQ